MCSQPSNPHPPAWPSPGKARNLHPLPLPAFKPANQPTNQKGQAGFVPRSRPPAGVSTPPVNALRILSLSYASQPAPFPADSSNDRLSPPRGPRARRICPQGPGRRTSRLPPPIQVRPTPRRSTNPRLQALRHPGPPPKAGGGAPSPAGSPSSRSACGSRGADSSARARFGRRAPTWPQERARGGAGPPASPPGWRVAGEGDPTGRGAAHLPQRDRGSARLRLRAATPRRPAPAPNIYPHPGGRGGGAGRELAPESAAPATPPLSRSDEWLPAPGGAATARPDTSAPQAPALTPAPGGGAWPEAWPLRQHSLAQWGQRWEPGPQAASPLGAQRAGRGVRSVSCGT